jgi:hypothetical protein
MPRADAARRRSTVALVAVVAVAVAVGLGACAPRAADPSPGTDSGLPAGLAVSVQQGRIDVPQGRLVVHLENAGEPVTVTALEVRSPALEPGMRRDDPFELDADDAIDVRLGLTPSVCDADPGAIEIALDVRNADGTEHSGKLSPDDPFGTMARIADADCLAESVAAVAAITMPERLRSEGTGSARRAWVDVRVEPAAAGTGTLRIDGVSATTLLGAEDGRDWPLDLEVAAGDAPTTIELAVRPARCDAHALADDKRGTILPFAVATGDGREGRLELPAGDALKADLYAYYVERCGLATPPA